MVEFKGKWKIDWDKFASAKGQGLKSWDEFCSTSITIGSNKHLVNDVCPYELVNGRESFYMRVIPYGPNFAEIDDVIEDCDLLMYIEDRRPAEIDIANISKGDFGTLLNLLKQHGFHAEAGYHGDDGYAHQVGLWSDRPVDRRFHESETQQYTINIFRLSFPWLQDKDQKRLKRELHKWKRLFNKHTFPGGQEMLTDPVDFTNISELSNIAKRLINRPPDTPTGLNKVNCVQWVCQAVALALNYPLTRAVVDQLEMSNVFEQHLINGVYQIDYSDDDLTGLDTMPVRFYSPARVLQTTIDMYGLGIDIADVLKLSSASEITEKLAPYLPAGLTRNTIENYIITIQKTGDIDTPFYIKSDIPYKIVMPSTFLVECREHTRIPPAQSPMISYIGTAVHQDFVTRN